MPLTVAQLQSLKVDVAANAVVITFNGAPAAVQGVPHTSDGAAAVAAWYSQAASPAFWVWQTGVPVQDVYDQVAWANFTPADAPDATVQWSNRSLACQGKQFNLELMLQGRDSFNASKINLRSGLNDATTALPSGAGGASRSGGWANILAALRRQASNVEKLFAAQTSGVGVTSTDALGAATNPGLMGYEGPVSGTDVVNAWNS